MADSDIWFRAATEGLRYVAPVSGAEAAYKGGFPQGKDGCVAASLSTDEVLIKVFPAPGFYVCVLTYEGRYSDLQVYADVDAETITISYTTWE